MRLLFGHSLAADARPEQPACSGRGRPPAARYRGPFSSLADLAVAAGPDACQTVTWREGRGPMTSRFLAIQVRPADVKLRRSDPDGELPLRWLRAEWPDGKDTPVSFWLATCPPTPPSHGSSS